MRRCQLRLERRSRALFMIFSVIRAKSKGNPPQEIHSRTPTSSATTALSAMRGWQQPVQRHRTGPGRCHASVMDLQPRAVEYGTRRHHANAEAGIGRIVPLLATAENGGITACFGRLRPKFTNRILLDANSELPHLAAGPDS